MDVLYPLSDFISSSKAIANVSPAYWYEGRCMHGELVRLPRTHLAEAIARGLMQHLASTLR